MDIVLYLDKWCAVCVVLGGVGFNITTPLFVWVCFLVSFLLCCCVVVCCVFWLSMVGFCVSSMR